MPSKQRLNRVEHARVAMLSQTSLLASIDVIVKAETLTRSFVQAAVDGVAVDLRIMRKVGPRGVNVGQGEKWEIKHELTRSLDQIEQRDGLTVDNFLDTLSSYFGGKKFLD